MQIPHYPTPLYFKARVPTLTADFTVMCPFEWEAEMLGTGFSTSGMQKGDGYPSRMLRPSLNACMLAPRGFHSHECSPGNHQK